MNLVNSIADMAMSMSQTKFQQNVQMTMMKKSMETSVDLARGVLDMANAVPHFPGANGSLLDVRA